MLVLLACSMETRAEDQDPACAWNSSVPSFGHLVPPALKPIDGEFHLSLSYRPGRQQRSKRPDGVFIHRAGVIAFDQRSHPDAAVLLRNEIPLPALIRLFQGKADRLALPSGQTFDSEPNVIGTVLHAGDPSSRGLAVRLKERRPPGRRSRVRVRKSSEPRQFLARTGITPSWLSSWTMSK